MINVNCKLTSVDILSHRFSIEISDPELSKLNYKYGGIVGVNITKPTEPGTENQNRAMHSLLVEYYKTGMHSAPEGYTIDDFKEYMKCLYGVSKTFILDGKEKCFLKSWAKYTKQERTEFIDGLISEIQQSGAYAESEKIRQIIDGMQKDDDFTRGAR